MNREELRNHEEIWLDTIVEDQAAGPTSRLHDYAVGMVYDALQAGVPTSGFRLKPACPPICYGMTLPA